MKALNIKSYPETVNGMKTRLFARYINWFNQMIPASSFSFNYYMVTRSSAIRYFENELISSIGDVIKEKKIKSTIKRINSSHEPKHIPCGSVGCFTGWSNHCRIIFTEKEANNNGVIDTSMFGHKLGIDNNLARFIFMPDTFYHVAAVGESTPAPFIDIGNADRYITKKEMLERCVKFLNYVVAGDIDPNPLADMRNEIRNSISVN